MKKTIFYVIMTGGTNGNKTIEAATVNKDTGLGFELDVPDRNDTITRDYDEVYKSEADAQYAIV